jgi:RimJ/RimL family protein N-acetyltransferase
MAIKLFEASDLSDIHYLLTSNHWDFYLDPLIDEAGVRVRGEDYFSGDGNVTLVSRSDQGVLEGFIHFDTFKNSDENAPSFNISVDKGARGKGIGTQLVKEGIKYIFEHHTKIRRIYATTREDNIPMQKVFESLGFRLEATHKKEWKIRETGAFVDELGYALLKEDCDWL